MNEYLKKSAPPFALAHVIVAKRAKKSQGEVHKAGLYGASIGKYYQAANDHHDCFTIPADKRGGMDEMVPLNFSIPFYLYCRKNPEFAARLGSEVTRQELSEIVEAMKGAGIQEKSAQYVQTLRGEIEANFPGDSVPDELHGFLDMVNTSQFWSYQYSASASSGNA